MPTPRIFVLATSVAVLAAATFAPADATLLHHRRPRHAAHRDDPRTGDRRPYASSYRPSTTCRTADGTPYDPDLIGGVNHVGDGGPAVNFGTGLGDPCDPAYLGGPGLIGPR